MEYMVTTHYTLPQNSYNLPLPSFGGNYPIVLLDNIIIDCICILTYSPGYIFLMIVYVIWKIRGNENSPNSLNVMVNYHYYGKNRVITR